MQQGKLSESIISRSVIKEIHTKNPEYVLTKAQTGRDSGEVKVNNNAITATTTVNLGEGYWCLLGINRVANDIACAGGIIRGCLLNITMPSKFNEKFLKEIMRQADATCKDLSIAIIGGHTELSDYVTKPIVSITGIGDKLYDVKGVVKPGHKIALTKWIGMEGSYLLSQYRKDELEGRFPNAILDFPRNAYKWISIMEEAGIAAESGVSYMHNLSHGGILNALWELAVYSKKGMRVDYKKIPVKQETIEICEMFNLNPYRLLSGGSLLMTFDPECDIVGILAQHEIPVQIIGEITDNNDKILINDDEERFIDVTCRDELWKIIDTNGDKSDEN